MQYVLDGNGSRLTSVLHNGEYDPNLVCRDCEDLFNAGDDYAKRLLVDGRRASNRKFEGKSAFYEYTDVDYKNLKLFFISLLWRAHATSLASFDKVDLGEKYEKLAKKMIKQADPGSANDFAVFILRIADGPLHRLGSTPTPRKMPPNNVRVYDLLLFGYLVYIKVDRRPYGYPFQAEQLTPGRRLWMIETALEDTPYHDWAVQAYNMGLATKEKLRNARRP